MNFPVKYRQTRPSGFALVSALLLMVLLSITAIALLGLSSITLRKAAGEGPLIEARSNARLALMMAIDQLQKNVGPDQRVTADNRILDPTSEDGPDRGERHWINVWKTTKNDGSPFIVRNSDDGGLQDTRVESNWNPAEERLTTLVSGNENKYNFHEFGTGGGQAAELVRLVGSGSIPSSNGASPDFVNAPKVDLKSGGRLRGSYAWWVGDLNLKANISTQDRFQDADGFRSLQLAQDSSLRAFDDQDDLENSLRGKIFTTGQLDLTNPSTSPLSKRAFHDITTESHGVLVNVREGGLKKDLSAYLESNGSVPDLKSDSGVMPGIRDMDRLVGPRNNRAEALSPFPGQASRYSLVSPTFALLRDWARSGEEENFGNLKSPMINQEITSSASRVGFTKGGGVKHLQRSQTDLMPVLVESSMFYNISYYLDPEGQQKAPYHLRLHYYPRVALWNPYNFDLDIGSSIIALMINGAKRVKITSSQGTDFNFEMYFGLEGAARGTMFFALEGTTLKPGETAVWSPSGNRIYDEKIFSNNRLTTTQAPSPTRGFYKDKLDTVPQALFSAIQTNPKTSGLYDDRMKEEPLEWREYVGSVPTGNVQASGYTQADDYKVIWKPMRQAGSVDMAKFEALPMGLFVSCALQYGDEDEMPVEWSSSNPVPIARSAKGDPVIGAMPDTRTRDGFRLRWFDEPYSNRIGSGSLSGTHYLQEAPLANWNMRASYSFRSPFENINDTAPNFFGIYTRDLFDPEVGWAGMNPSYKQGSYCSDPFDQPTRFSAPRILFDVPRRGAEVVSLGAFQQVKFSEYIWHPTFAFGNSLADPRIDPTRTEPNRKEDFNKDEGGWNRTTIGYSTDGRSKNQNFDENGVSDVDLWAYYARNYLDQAAVEQNLIFDLSYELNNSLWDEFFLSTGNADEKRDFIESPKGAPLPNGRLELANPVDRSTESALLDFHRAASELMVEGAFNVNSTSVKAWEALLLSSIGNQYGADSVTFPRILRTQSESSDSNQSRQWNGDNPRDEAAWAGQRTFSPGEIRRLAEEIVSEVKLRGPFLSMADFVNRRLSDDDTGKKGTLQAAIDRSGINDSFKQEWRLDNTDELPDYEHPDHINDPTRINQKLKPETQAWGALGFLTQADLLQFLGPVLTVRSDSFIIRAYGSSVDSHGKVIAEAWCEAVVQRLPQPVNPDDLGLNPDPDYETDFGRKLEIKRFRWLKREEV